MSEYHGNITTEGVKDKKDKTVKKKSLAAREYPSARLLFIMKKISRYLACLAGKDISILFC